MAFPESFLQELTERNEISDVVSAYVKLNKRSGSNLFGLCPFHSEKTPSFSVAPDKQIYHCFGCGKGGGVINFIMELENLSYPDAVRFLARRVGLEVPEDKPDENQGRREKMLGLNRDAARFFHDRLSAPNGEIARQYVQRREVSPAMVNRFGLGFAPNSFFDLCDAMLKKGYSKTELLDAGLARPSKKGDGGIYDTFRNRLMFPVIDVRGSVIGFSGRILDDGEPKYMNSPETLVFSKSRNLFAMNLAKKSKKGYIILSEGNIDVVALHQAGFDCAVASLGTSLTSEQARLIARYQENVVIIYDGDNAGQKASQRAINILGQLNLKVKLVRLKDAKDPDEFIKKFGATAFENLINGSERDKDYLLTDIASKYDLTNNDDKLAFLKDATAFVAGFWDDMEREVYARELAKRAEVSYDAVVLGIGQARKKLTAKAKKTEEREETRVIKRVQPSAKSIRFQNIRSAAAEQGVIRLLYSDPSLFLKNPGLVQQDFSSPELGRFYGELLERTRAGSQPVLASLAGIFNGDEMSLLTEIIQQPTELSNSDKALSDYINIIKTEKLASQKTESADGSEMQKLAERLRESKGYGRNK